LSKLAEIWDFASISNRSARMKRFLKLEKKGSEKPVDEEKG
jgi:hypothetical protein